MLILQKFPKNKEEKRGIVTSLISSFIGLAYEHISSLLHHRRHKSLHKPVKAMETKVDIQHHKLFHLQDSMVMYGVHNAKH